MKLQDLVYALISAAITAGLFFEVLDAHWMLAAGGALAAATSVIVLAQRHTD